MSSILIYNQQKMAEEEVAFDNWEEAEDEPAFDNWEAEAEKVEDPSA